MARTASAEKIRDRFTDDVGRLKSFFHRTSAALRGTESEQADVSRLSLAVFTSAAVSFESFWSDLFIALVNRKPAVYQAHLVIKARRQIDEHVSGTLRPLVSVGTPSRLTVQDVSAFLDAQGRNVTFPSASALSRRAGQWLDPSFAAPIRTLANTEGEMYEAVRELRNYVAHRSPESRNRFNDATAKLSPGPYAPLHRGDQTTRNAGSYLKAYMDTPTGKTRRVMVYTDWMKRSAAGLTVT